MYTIKMDGKILYHPERLDDGFKALAPKASLDINKNGSCSFVLPPGNRMRQDVRRRKSVVTIHQDGEEIFRGRVLDSENDTYNQKSVYCEGIRSYLNDSQAAPYLYAGTPRGLLAKLIEEHNDQVEEEKHFTVGEVTVERADEAMECENVAYWETFKEIDEKLLSAYGGYMKPRIEGGVQYLDWLAAPGRKNQQKIRFSINLLDIKDKQDAADMFTILRPLGAASISDDGEQGDPVTIASVNDGLDYIVDEDAAAEYGRIWKTQTWPYIEDPAKLLEKGREFMKIGAELRTITLKAIDMHFLDGSVDAIRAGDEVHILSLPHGIDLVKVCCKIELDLANPEETTYTFGEPPKALTDNIVTTEEEIDAVTGFKGGGGRGSVKQQMKDILRWAKINVDEDRAKISLIAGERYEDIAEGFTSLKQAGIDIDGALAKIALVAGVEYDSIDGTQTISGAYHLIDGQNGVIESKVSKDGVISSINQSAEAVTINASKINLEGYVTIENYEAWIADLEAAFAETIVTDYLTVTETATISALALDGSNVSKTKLSVITGISGGVTTGTDTTLLTTSVGDSYTVQAGSADAVYSNGVQSRFIQGDEYTEPLYEPGTSFSYTEQGSEFTGVGATQVETRTYRLRGDSVDRALYTTSSVSVTKQGSAYSQGPLYVSTGGTYRPVGRTLYEAGSSATYYNRSKYADEGELYWSDGSETVTVITEEYDGALYKAGTNKSIKKQGDLLETALYREGTEYSGGLYTNFEPATLTLRDVTALTV